MNNEKHILLYDMATWWALENYGIPNGRIVIWTTHPSVIECLNEKYKVVDLTKDISVKRLNALGDEVQEISQHWCHQINDHFSGKLLLNETGFLLGKGMPQLLSSCVYVMECMQPLLQRSNKLMIPFFSDLPQNHLSGTRANSLVHITTNYFALAAEVLVADNPMVEMVALSSEVECSRHDDFNNRKFKNKFSFLRTFCELSLIVSARVDKLWTICYRRFRRYKPLKYIPIPDLASRDVVILKDSYPIHRLLPRLWLKGYRIGSTFVSSDCKIEEDQEDNNLSILEKKLISAPSLYVEIKNIPYLNIALTIAARRITSYLRYTFIPFAKSMSESIGHIQRLKEKDSFLLSNCIVGPIDNLTAAAYRLAGARTICFQHGGIGLLEQQSTMQRYSDMVQSDRYVCFSKHEIDFYRNVTGDLKMPFFIQGSGIWQRIRFPRIARWFARRLWKVKTTEKAVLYAPTRFKEGHMWLPNSIQDTHYWDIMKTVIDNVMGQTKAKCFVKIHQKGINAKINGARYAQRVHPLEVSELPGNVALKHWPDLTYCRCAADILIIDRATSTLGWAVESNVPLIYLESEFNPLTPEVRVLMENALFVINVNEDGWVERIRELLNMPLEQLQSLWNDMKPDRQIFLNQYVVGPQNTTIDSLVDWLHEVT